MACYFNMTLSRSSLKVKVIGPMMKKALSNCCDGGPYSRPVLETYIGNTNRKFTLG